jgi:UPF0716 protein FxsA
VAPQRRRGGSWILPLILVAMVALPILEIFLLIQVGQVIGIWWTLAILVGEALLGAWLMRREGNRAWKALNEAFASGKMPAGELADTALILVGGVLLMMPGFVTDVFGLLFLLPFTRPLARKVLAYFLARRMSRLGMSTMYVRRDGTVIEGETVPDPQTDPRTTQAPTQSSSGPVIIAGEIESEAVSRHRASARDDSRRERP